MAELEDRRKRMQVLQDRLDQRIGRRKAVTGELRRKIEAEIFDLRVALDPELADVREHRALVRAEAIAETSAALAKQGVRKAEAGGPTAPHRPVVEVRTVENPMLTDGLIDAAAKGEVRIVKAYGAPHNMTLLIGGLSRVRSLSDEQREAAARYRSLYEGSMIGAAGAIDYAQPRVDVSAKATNPADGGMDARRRYAEAVQALGPFQSSLVENVVCHEMSVRDLAKRLGAAPGGRSSERVKCQLLDAVDQLVEHFGMVAQPGREGRVRRMREAVPVQWGLGSSGVAVATREEGVAEAALDALRKGHESD